MTGRLGGSGGWPVANTAAMIDSRSMSKAARMMAWEKRDLTSKRKAGNPSKATSEVLLLTANYETL